MMKAKRLTLHNERMLYFIDFLIANKIEKNEHTILKKIGFEFTNNISQIRKGTRGFRVEHMQNLCEKYNADGNFFILRKYNSMFRQGKIRSEIMLLKESVAVVAMKMAELSKS